MKYVGLIYYNRIEQPLSANRHALIKLRETDFGGGGEPVYRCLSRTRVSIDVFSLTWEPIYRFCHYLLYNYLPLISCLPPPTALEIAIPWLETREAFHMHYRSNRCLPGIFGADFHHYHSLLVDVRRNHMVDSHSDLASKIVIAIFW